MQKEEKRNETKGNVNTTAGRGGGGRGGGGEDKGRKALGKKGLKKHNHFQLIVDPSLPGTGLSGVRMRNALCASKEPAITSPDDWH